MGLLARNQLPGTIEDVQLGEIMAHVVELSMENRDGGG
jgi:hypothetical protein